MKSELLTETTIPRELSVHKTEEGFRSLLSAPGTPSTPVPSPSRTDKKRREGTREVEIGEKEGFVHRPYNSDT